MSLLEPTLGEIVDRITILELKKAHCSNADTLSQLNEECSRLELELEERIRKSSGPVSPVRGHLELAFIVLRYVNKQIWGMEDEIRRHTLKDVLRLESVHETRHVAALGIRIAEANDTRAGVVLGLDKLVGVISPGKIYEK